MPARRTAAVLVLLGALTTVTFAGIRAPGKYCGIVVFDRWGGCTLYSGIYVMYVSESVKQQLRAHAGEFVQIDATKVDQPKNPGDGLISELKYLGSDPQSDSSWIALDGLDLQAEPAFTDGERPRINISLHNSGKQDLKIVANEFAPTLLAHKPPASVRFFHPADGPSYALITRQSFHGRASGEFLYFDQKSYGWRIDAPVPETFILKPGEKRAVVMSFDLPAGEFDFLAGYGGGVHENKMLASPLIAFDVDDKGNGILVKVEERNRTDRK